MSDVTRLIARAREIAPFSEDEQLLFDLARELEKAQPRIIETVEELDALPYGAVIFDGDGDLYQKNGDNWYAPAELDYYRASWLNLPATILHESKEETK